MSPREDDYRRYIAPPWSMSPQMAKTAARLNELEAEEGKERRDQIVKWAHGSPWSVDQWLDALDAIWRRHSRWEMIEEAYKLGMGPNFAIVLSDLLDIEERERPPSWTSGRISWKWLIGFFAAVIFFGFAWALIEAIVS